MNNAKTPLIRSYPKVSISKKQRPLASDPQTKLAMEVETQSRTDIRIVFPLLSPHSLGNCALMPFLRIRVAVMYQLSFSFIRSTWPCSALFLRRILLSRYPPCVSCSIICVYGAASTSSTTAARSVFLFF